MAERLNVECVKEDEMALVLKFRRLVGKKSDFKKGAMKKAVLEALSLWMGANAE